MPSTSTCCWATGAGGSKISWPTRLARSWHGPLSLEPHLQHAAVMATRPSGQANAQAATMSTADVFHAAAEQAKLLLGGDQGTGGLEIVYESGGATGQRALASRPCRSPDNSIARTAELGCGSLAVAPPSSHTC